MQDRVALPREQRVSVNAALRRQLFEAAPFEFVSNEYFTLAHRLIIRQFFESKFQLIEQYSADIERFWSGIRRWQKIFEPKQFALFVLYARVAEALCLLLTEKVRDAIARHAKQPAGHVVDRHQQAVRFHQLVEDVLQNVLSVARIGHAPADKIAQPGSFCRDDFRDLPILVEALLVHLACAQQLIKPLL